MSEVVSAATVITQSDMGIMPTTDECRLRIALQFVHIVLAYIIRIRMGFPIGECWCFLWG